jgi:hypothetical protein
MLFNWDRFLQTRLGIGGRTLRVPISGVAATEAAVTMAKREGISLAELLARHQCGDWGDVTDAEWTTNEKALEEGGTVMSLYDVGEGIHLWIFTEPDGRTMIALGEDF